MHLITCILLVVQLGDKYKKNNDLDRVGNSGFPNKHSLFIKSKFEAKQ